MVRLTSSENTESHAIYSEKRKPFDENSSCEIREMKKSSTNTQQPHCWILAQTIALFPQLKTYALGLKT